MKNEMETKYGGNAPTLRRTEVNIEEGFASEQRLAAANHGAEALSYFNENF